VCPARARTHIVRRERRAPHARRTRGRVQREAHATRRGPRTRADTRGRARRACRGDTRGAVRRADGASGAPVCLRGARRAEASDCSRTEDADNTRSASSASTVRARARHDARPISHRSRSQEIIRAQRRLDGKEGAGGLGERSP
jgi:hypothetical protein